jgi:hypothetical protein
MHRPEERALTPSVAVGLTSLDLATVRLDGQILIEPRKRDRTRKSFPSSTTAKTPCETRTEYDQPF